MTGFEIFLAAVAVGGTAKSIQAGQDAAKQSKVASRLSQQQQALVAARERRDAIRQARIATAAVTQSGETQGASTSSAAAGGLASITSQLSSNLSFLDQNKVLADQGTVAFGKMRDAEATASAFGQVAGMAGTAYGNAGQISKSFSTIFKPRIT